MGCRRDGHPTKTYSYNPILFLHPLECGRVFSYPLGDKMNGDASLPGMSILNNHLEHINYNSFLLISLGDCT
jgi:hypothetical protein